MNDNLNGECVVIGNTLMSREKKQENGITKIGIYGLRNKLKPYKWYIGQSVDIIKRWEKDYRRLKCEGQPKLYYALQKYGYDGFDKILLEECTPDKKTLDERETQWMIHYNSIEGGYNLRGGGRGHGWHSEETKAKIREARRRQITHRPSEEAIERMREARAGIPLSGEHRLKLSASHMGNKQSDETKAKISKALLGIKRGHCTVERKLKKSLSMLGKCRTKKKL